MWWLRHSVPCRRCSAQLLAAELASACGWLLLAVGPTILTQQLFEWIIGNAHVRGDKQLAAFIYAEAYVEAVFERTCHKLSGNQWSSELFRGAVESAMLDVAEDMRGPEVQLDFPRRATPVYDPVTGIQDGYWNGAKDALRMYAKYLTAAANNNEASARHEANLAARRKAERRYGL